VIRVFFRLLRPRLSLVNGVAATGGYLLFPATVDPAAVTAVMTGVTLLAAGGSALNQVLEQDLDRLMVRTKGRPLPQGDLRPSTATLMGGCCILAGFLALFISGGITPALLGVGALAWYLGVYTPLKRRTPFALPLGAVCGAIPPVIGWCVAGGTLGDFRVILLAGLLYLWQIPHFWLFQRRHELDYRNAGIPLVSEGYPGTTPVCFFRLWVIALIAVVLLLPAFGIVGQQGALWSALAAVPLLGMSGLRFEPALFSYLNFFPILLTLILYIQK
jgi:protoheme IX farnesyltransferase